MTDFGALWNRLHREHGRAAIVGDNATEEVAYVAGGARDLEHVIRLVGPLTGKHVMDYGCGDGRVSQHAAKNAKTLACVDASSEVLDRCRARVSGNNVTFVNAQWPAEVETPRVDIVFALAVAYHLTDLQTFRLMRDMRDRLVPCGKFLFDFCNVMHPLYDDLLTSKMVGSDWTQPWPWVAQNGDTLVRVARLLGYRAVDLYNPGAAQPSLLLTL